MARLPHDILREIGRYWAGHRLLYTCAALYASWNPDNYIATKRREVESDCVDTRVTVSRMPNGVYHGKCVSTRRYKQGITSVETIEYNRGRVVLVTLCNNRTYCATTIIDGRTCHWTGYGVHDTSGRVYACVTTRKNVRFCDFIAVASKMVAQDRMGWSSEIRIFHNWGEHMPGTSF